MTNSFVALSNDEMMDVLGGGLGTALIGGAGGALTGFIAGGKAGVTLSFLGPHTFAACLIGGTVGGALTGFVTFW